MERWVGPTVEGVTPLVGAAVHEALRAARDAGSAILVYSSDLDEVLSLSDRVYAMHDGTVSETNGERDAVGRAMLGGNAHGNAHGGADVASSEAHA